MVEPIQVLDAAEFGVPQRRRRVFVLGYKRGLTPPEYPTPSHPRDGGRNGSPTVWDAIGDLPNITRYDYLFETEEFMGKLGSPSNYASVLRGGESRSSRQVPSSEQEWKWIERMPSNVSHPGDDQAIRGYQAGNQRSREPILPTRQEWCGAYPPCGNRSRARIVYGSSTHSPLPRPLYNSAGSCKTAFFSRLVSLSPNQVARIPPDR